MGIYDVFIYWWQHSVAAVHATIMSEVKSFNSTITKGPHILKKKKRRKTVLYTNTSQTPKHIPPKQVSFSYWCCCCCAYI